jgi:hypothetical protein
LAEFGDGAGESAELVGLAPTSGVDVASLLGASGSDLPLLVVERGRLGASGRGLGLNEADKQGEDETQDDEGGEDCEEQNPDAGAEDGRLGWAREPEGGVDGEEGLDHWPSVSR